MEHVTDGGVERVRCRTLRLRGGVLCGWLGGGRCDVGGGNEGWPLNRKPGFLEIKFCFKSVPLFDFLGSLPHRYPVITGIRRTGSVH